MSSRLLLVLSVVVLLPSVVFAGEKLPKPTRQPAAPTANQKALLAQGVVLHDAGKFDGAIDKYEEVLKLSPANMTALYELAYSFAANKELEKSLAAATRGAPSAQGARLSRGDVVRQLGSRSGRHLVFVRYEPDASIHVEWVYNPADISAAPVVFAHDLGPARNSALIAELPGRSIWTARVSQGNAVIVPYTDDTPLQPPAR